MVGLKHYLCRRLQLATILLNHHIGHIVLGSMCVGSFSVVGLEHYPCHRLQLATILLNHHIGRIVLGSICVGVSVWLG